jgi:hypothetical protein
MRYIVGRYYRAGTVEYQAGQVIEIEDAEYAAWLKRDMGGYLTPVVEPERVVEKPPQDRMVRRASKRKAV